MTDVNNDDWDKLSEVDVVPDSNPVRKGWHIKRIKHVTAEDKAATATTTYDRFVHNHDGSEVLLDTVNLVPLLKIHLSRVK